MRLRNTLFTKLKSLSDFLEDFSRKKLLVGAVGLGVAACGATSASAALFLDDFESDTSANYTYEDSYGSAGSFSISGGKLNLHTDGSNTASVFTTSTVAFEVGESLAVDGRPVSGAEGNFLTLGTAATQPGKSGSFGFRWRQDTFGANDDGIRIFAVGETFPSLSGVDPNPLDPATLWIDRLTTDTFEFLIQKTGTPGRTSFGTVVYAPLSGITNLHIGVQAFDSPVDDFPFDNLRIVTTALIPEPSTATLALLVGITGLFSLRRRRRA